MSIYIAPRLAPSKAVLGPGAAAMMTLAPVSSAIRDPRQMMRLAQMLFHSNRYVFKAESTISFAFSTVDWHLEDDEDNEILAETANGPSLAALNLLEKPRDALPGRQGMTRSQLWSLTSRHMGLCGSAFWLGDQNEGLAGTPLALLYINPARMTPAEDEQGNLTGWVLDAKYDIHQGQIGTPLSLEEVYHFKLNEPDTGHFGIGNVESFWSADHLTSLSDQHAVDVLATGGRLAGIVSAKTGGTIPDNVFQQLIRDFRTINEQPNAAKHTSVLQGPIDFTRTSATPTELNLLELMKMAKEDTYEHWGVPPSQIGGATAAGLNSGDVRKYDRAAMWQNAIHPRLTNFWEVIQYQLLDRYQDLGATVELEIEEPEFDDDSPRYDLLAKSATIMMSENERRALIGADPIPVEVLGPSGGPLGDEYWLPMSQVMVASGTPPPQGASPTEQALGRAEPAQAESPQNAASGAAGETSSGKASPFHTSLTKLRTTIDRRMTPKLRESVQTFLHAQRAEIAARVRSLPAYRLKDAEHLFPAKTVREWDTRLTAALKPHMAGVAETVHGHIAATFGRPGKAGPLAPHGAVAYVLNRGAARVTKINQTTREGIASIIADGIDAGMGPAELGDAVEGWTGFSEYRGELIARTELMDAYNAAALGSYDEFGVTMVEAIDGDGDEECAARDGQTFTLEEADGIEDHPNGTLDWVPVLEAA